MRNTPLVPARCLLSPQSYRQLSQQLESERFRADLDSVIGSDVFTSLCQKLVSEGAVSMSSLLSELEFNQFQRSYDAEMKIRGSRGSLHSYLNLATSRSLLGDMGLWKTVAHPLFVALIAYAMGGPVKIVDMRGKDTHPVDVVARDNTLHLDNSPFMDEYKVVVTWRLGTTEGPTGQGLTYLPRMNSLFRQSIVEPDGTVWGDEDACIFPTQRHVDSALRAQSEFLDEPGPLVVHLSGIAFPCHTIFAASRLAHQRYRTSTGASRSAVMTSFHRADHSPEFIKIQPPFTSGMNNFLVTGGVAEKFFESVQDELVSIHQALESIENNPNSTVDFRKQVLMGEDLERWYQRQSKGVNLNELRSQNIPTGELESDSLTDFLIKNLQYDLQGPLNMPFFADLREARRKRARIWLREMSAGAISALVRSEHVSALREVPAHTDEQDGASTSDLGSYLADLDRLLAGSCGLKTRAGQQDFGEMEAALSLPAFVTDLRVTASWLDDTDSRITATAFAFLASAMGNQCFVLGDAGQRITQQLLHEYLILVSER